MSDEHDAIDDVDVPRVARSAVTFHGRRESSLMQQTVVSDGAEEPSQDRVLPNEERQFFIAIDLLRLNDLLQTYADVKLTFDEKSALEFCETMIHRKNDLNRTMVVLAGNNIVQAPRIPLNTRKLR